MTPKKFTVILLAVFGLATAFADSTFAVNNLENEPTYTVGLTNSVLWPDTGDVCTAVTRRILQYDTNPDFTNPREVLGIVPGSWEPVQNLEEHQYWYRAICMNDTTNGVITSIQDATPPQIDSCWFSYNGATLSDTTNQSNFDFEFIAIDPAGIEWVELYVRYAGDTEWDGPIDTYHPGADITSYQGLYSMDSLVTSNPDNTYEIGIVARDFARAPDYLAGHNTTPDGNISDSILSCNIISVDNSVPTATINTDELDSLYAVDTTTIFWSAAEPYGEFFSGLEAVILHWSAYESNTGNSLGSDSVVLASMTEPSVLSDSGSELFSFVYDNAYYWFQIEAIDRAGNSNTTDRYDSVRVQTGIMPTLLIWDLLDTDDYEYSGARTCGVRVEIEGLEKATALFLCDNYDPPDYLSCDQYDYPSIPFEGTFEFAPPDSTKSLYAIVWIGDTGFVASDTITIDLDDPVLTSIDLTGNVTDDTQIRVLIQGSDEPLDVTQPLQYLILAENEQFTKNVDTTLGRTFNQEFFYNLTDDLEQKTIYAKVIDYAENESNSVNTTILLGDKAHNFPNPFNPDDGEIAKFVFVLPEAGEITIAIYDLFGHLVREWTTTGVEGLNSGSAIHGNENLDLRWDGLNGKGEPVASGGYIGAIELDGETISTFKIAVMR